MLIKKIISSKETINLVVVPCNVDIATTEALKMAQEVDPKGERTLGKIFFWLQVWIFYFHEGQMFCTAHQNCKVLVQSY